MSVKMGRGSVFASLHECVLVNICVTESVLPCVATMCEGVFFGAIHGAWHITCSQYQ